MPAAVLPARMRNLNAQFWPYLQCTAKLASQIHVFHTSLPLYLAITQNTLNGLLATALFQIMVKHPVWWVADMRYSCGFAVSSYGELPDTLRSVRIGCSLVLDWYVDRARVRNGPGL